MKEGSHGRRKSKKAVYSQMLKLRCVGPFLAKNMMHLWKKSSKQRLFPDDKTYSEHGPGARAAINVARQWPPTANLYSSSDSARQIYNQCCDDWRRKRQCFARVRATHLPEVRQAKATLKRCLSDPEDFQVMLCEYHKLITFAVSRHRSYLR